MSLAGSTILVLEDEPIIGLALEDVLMGEGAFVLLASGMEEARQLIASRAIDSAILDVNVHGVQSYPVALLLAEQGVPFIFATGYGDRSHPPEFAGVPTIAKPYSLGDIQSSMAIAGFRDDNARIPKNRDFH
jgi:DNA-binding response OmpR family regulator